MPLQFTNMQIAIAVFVLVLVAAIAVGVYLKHRKTRTLALRNRFGTEYERAAPSAAAKAGIVAMTRSLAVEWGPHHIRLNAVAPGLFPTEGAWEKLYPPGSQVEPQQMSVPLRRVGEHAELANLFAFLAADESSYLTGDLIVIDGGRWMQGVGGPSNRAMHDWTGAQWDAMRKR